VLFLGTTRGVTDGVVTSGLQYDAHAPMAGTLLERLREEAVTRFGLSACAVQHRLGPVAVGEASVAIATSAPHRREAFAAAEWLIDRIKREVPIWKCEETPDGGRAWIHPAEPPDTAPDRSFNRVSSPDIDLLFGPVPCDASASTMGSIVSSPPNTNGISFVVFRYPMTYSAISI
jgi:molybdopterin synthase catalytic subunit